MIKVDETDPIGEVELSFPYRDVQIQRGIDPKECYDLETEIGRGKFGTVYRCREKSTGLALAAKFVAVPKKEDRRNVEREVDIMRSLQHPRLIQLYDAFENGKVMCVILELIDGGELFERVIDDDFVLTEKSCTVFMRQICEGIEFIHKQYILHLDMKPENILCLTKSGNRIKIIDFGLARKYDPSKNLQVLFGTPEFVAPEVVNFDQISFGTDMWSVGVICYVLLSGLSPFMGENDVVTMANVTIAKYDFDDEAFKEISETAKDFIAKLLVKNPKERMTAEECLRHPWLQRRMNQHRPSMDVTKDNLRQFVERWSEHPNSPYVFELTSRAISPCATTGIQLSDSLPSLAGMSPSPCGSLASSAESTDDDTQTFTDHHHNNHNMTSPNPTNNILDFARRSSDSSCVVRAPNDVTEKVNLADEIRKLSDKLYQLSVMPDMTGDTTTTPSFTKPKQSEAITINHPPRINQDVIDSIPAWRRPKFRVSEMSRDVPLSPKMNGFATMRSVESAHHGNSFMFKSTTSSTAYTESKANNATSASGTKDLLLRLLEQWDGPQNSARQNTRSSSVAADWCENESLGQKTISSLNTFFQTRSTTKKTNPFLQQHQNGFK